MHLSVFMGSPSHLATERERHLGCSYDWQTVTRYYGQINCACVDRGRCRGNVRPFMQKRSETSSVTEFQAHDAGQLSPEVAALPRLRGGQLVLD